eukprot:CAMPEP_0197464856 /NCGR_PEP_ID=MMETSP1175-20131217/64244_1 /TAXON_ID=1003142 /ORGANISM="Triceratium dubium, Strain CCMP147" /LENGTH=126 /DNA_ID=CAMNT_0043000857 /DNA_START=78 /DNA_END=457 /DNA_ORIENTATION=-
MKSTIAVVAAALVSAYAPEQAAAFGSSSSFAGAQIQSCAQNAQSSNLSMEYIPSGMSKAQWEKLKNKEKNANKGKNLACSAAGGVADDSDIKGKKKGGFNFFGGGAKKKAPEPEPEPEKKTNWWTL